MCPALLWYLHLPSMRHLNQPIHFPKIAESRSIKISGYPIKDCMPCNRVQNKKKITIPFQNASLAKTMQMSILCVNDQVVLCAQAICIYAVTPRRTHPDE